MIRQIDLVRFAMFDDFLVRVNAGPVASRVDPWRSHDWSETTRLAGGGIAIVGDVVIESKKTIERVVDPKLPDAAKTTARASRYVSNRLVWTQVLRLDPPRGAAGLRF